MKALIAVAAAGVALFAATTTADTAIAEGTGRFVKPSAMETVGRWGRVTPPSVGRWGVIRPNVAGFRW